MSEVVQTRIQGDREDDGRVFPWTLVPGASARPFASTRLVAWLGEHRDEVFARAMEHGALLMRGFSVDTADDFAEIVEALDLENMPYIGGAAVRTRIAGDRVVTANEAPPSEPIPFHHEMAQVPHPPHYILFYCDLPPASGGETPIVRSHLVYRFAAERYPDFMARVEALGVRYIRVLPEDDDPTSAIGRSWRSTYGVETRAEAEARMAEMGTSWEWLPEGELRTVTKPLPAVRTDARTGHKTFFNSMIAAYQGWVDRRNDPTKAIVLGDDSPVDHEALTGIASFMRATCAAFPWQKGDVLLVDNRLTMHARSPFVPPRRILASVARGRRAELL